MDGSATAVSGIAGRTADIVLGLSGHLQGEMGTESRTVVEPRGH